MLDAALTVIDHSIRHNRRDDGLYHAYNLMESGAGKVSVEALYLMLEGQVAALSSGAIDPQSAIALIEALFDSDLFRPDQRTFLLYPDRELPGFLDKNKVPDEALDAIPERRGPIPLEMITEEPAKDLLHHLRRGLVLGRPLGQGDELGPNLLRIDLPRRRRIAAGSGNPLDAVNGLIKQFKTKNGALNSVDGVDLVVRRGETFGLIGPDGAGKTTLTRVILGLLRRSGAPGTSGRGVGGGV